MLTNVLKITLRNLWRNKVFSLINILGLTIGLFATIAIWLYIGDELNYDNMYTDGERIYRVTQTNIWNDEASQVDALGPAVSKVLQSALPEVDMVTRVHPEGDFLGTYQTEDNKLINFDEQGVLTVDSNFFQVFDLKMLYGNPNEALKHPYSIVLTQESAAKYFGTKDAIGKTIVLSRGTYEHAFQVSAVLASLPSNTHIQFDMLIPTSAIPQVKRMSWSWIWTTFVTYIKVKPNTPEALLKQKLAELPATHAEATTKRIFNQSYEEFVESRKPWKLYAQPLNQVYLYSASVGNRIGPIGDILYVRIFFLISLFTLTISGINFINLSTALAGQRAKEVGLRKVLGSDRKQLIRQFLIEAFMYSFLAFVFCLILLEFILPTFSKMTGKQLYVWNFEQPFWLVLIFSLPLVLGVFAGIYPAFYLTHFRPAKVLKGQFQSGRQSKNFRNSLVIFQFGVSSVLIISTLILYQQLHYLQNKKLGFAHDQLLVLPKVERLGEQLETFKDKLLTYPQIQHVSVSDDTPPYIWSQDYYQAGHKNAPLVVLNAITSDHDFLSTMGIHMASGRDFSEKFPTDTNNVILNESAVRALGWKQDDALGRYVLYNENQKYKVVGIMKDFHISSFRYHIEPVAIFLYHNNKYRSPHDFLSIRFDKRTQSSQQLQQLLSKIESSWKEVAPFLPFEYDFMSSLFAETYASETQTAWVLGLFTGLGIFIAVLGLFGLAIFTGEKRKKEIGIRKILGAKVSQIYVMLTKEYVKLILIAFILASPIAYYFMRSWLQGFAYQVTIGWASFLVPFLVMVAISALAVSYQSIRVSWLNPVDMIRDE